MQKKFILIIIILIPFFDLFSQDWEQCGGHISYAVNDIITFRDRLYAATSGGIYYSVDYGENWYEISYDQNFSHANSLIVHNKVLYAGSQNGVYKSSPNASYWFEISEGLPDNPGIRQIAIYDSILYAAGYKGIYFSTDEGENWKVFSESFQDSSITHITKYKDYFFAYVDYNGMFYSSDDGGSWQKLYPELNHFGRFVFEIIDDKIIADDGDVGLLAVDTPDKPWKSISISLDSVYIMGFYEYNGILFAGGARSIYFSLDNKESWAQMGYSKDFYATQRYTVLDHYIFLSSEFAIYRYKLTTLDVDEEEALSEIETLISPNPATTFIDISIQENSGVINNIRIHDCMGYEVKRINPKMTNSLHIGIEDLSSGAYYIVIETTKGIIRKTFLKI